MFPRTRLSHILRWRMAFLFSKTINRFLIIVDVYDLEYAFLS
jgi:hypothetical protein